MAFFRTQKVTLLYMRKFKLAALLSLAALSIQAAAPALKITRGNTPSTTKEQHTIVGVTSPGNKAYINGKEVHVYNTGAFGGEVALTKGQNVITVTAQNGNDTSVEKITINYTPATSTTTNVANPQPTTNAINPINVTTTANAYLQFGNGDDRLGGSKMGYLDADIPLKAVGQAGDLYMVQLSRNRFAYIPKELTTPSTSAPQVVNTGSWSIIQEFNADRISISLPSRLPYQSWTQLDPTTICIDLFGATNNSNWITQRSELGMIDYVDWQQVDSDVLRVIIKLKEKYSWGYSVGYNGNNLVIKVNHTPTLSLKGLTIGLDAGHGGKSSGAVSATGLKESDINLDIVMRIKEILEKKGAKVVLSRSGDVDLTMAQRKKIFLDADIDLMLSVHNNAGGAPLKEMGTSTFFKSIANRELAQCVLNRMLDLGVKSFGLTGNFNFSLNTPTEYPNLLLEALFMSSLPEEELLADPNFRQKIAQQAVRGIEDYLSLVKKSR